MIKRRRQIPLDVKQAVLHQAGYKCGNPSCNNIITLDVHHMAAVAKGGGNTEDNLLPLCGYCHGRHHAKLIPEASIRAWKMLRVALNEGFDRRSIETLLALDKLEVILRVSGDGVIGLGSLVASDLVSVEKYTHQTTGSYHSFEEQYQLRLTPRGQLFVRNWKAGDQQAALDAMVPTRTEPE